jgi:hypothetical protein
VIAENANALASGSGRAALAVCTSKALFQQ